MQTRDLETTEFFADEGAGFLAGSIARVHLAGSPLGPFADDDDDDDVPGGTSTQDGCEPDGPGYWG